MYKILVLLCVFVYTTYSFECKVNSDGYYCVDSTSYSWCYGGRSYSFSCPLGASCQTQNSSSFPCTSLTGEASDYGKFQSYQCSPSQCLPQSNCLCASNNPPGGLSSSQFPMIVFLTFDSGITPTTWPVFTEIFNEPLKNPTGCPISITWFFAPENSKASLLQEYIQNYNYEVALKSSNNGNSPPIDQIENARKTIANLGSIPESSIVGWRTPNLRYAPSTFEFISALGFLYDSSITEQARSPLSPTPSKKIFPYTLDYGVASNCQTGICDYRPGKGRYPGLWEIPVYTFDDANGTPLYVYDLPYDNSTVLEIWRNNFNYHYSGNRSPFGLYFTPAWFSQDNSRIALLKGFIKELLAKPDVYFLSGSQIIEFMKNPVSIQQAGSSRILNPCSAQNKSPNPTGTTTQPQSTITTSLKPGGQNLPTGEVSPDIFHSPSIMIQSNNSQDLNSTGSGVHIQSNLDVILWCLALIELVAISMEWGGF